MAVRVGIVGSGFIAIKHAEALKEIQGAELAGMCTYSDMDKLKAVSKRLDIPAFPSLDAMIKNGGLDAAMICSATVGHFEEIKRIAAEKIPMLVEKPVVGKKELYPQIYKLISQNGIRLFPGHNFVYRKSIRKMKEALAGGALGKVLQSSFTSTQFLDDFGSGHWRAKRVYSEGH